MKYKTGIFLIGMALWAGAACSKAFPEDPPSPSFPYPVSASTGTLCIRLEGALSTKVANPSAETEKHCERWAFWLFDQAGDGVVYGCGGAGEEIRRTVLTGTYTAVAVANYPDALVPERVKRIEDVRDRVALLSENAPGSLLMYGESPVELEKDQTAEAAVEVRRLVAKVGVKKVSVAFESPYLASKETVLHGIYLTNVYRSARLGKDYSAAELSPSRDAWYNSMGWHLYGDTDSASDALLGETGLDTVLTPEAPLTTPHYFYAYPNSVPADADIHEAEWAVRCTRLVLQVAVGNKVFYYQIPVPEMERNKVYLAEEVVIKGLGSQDPEQEIPGAIDVVFTAGGQEWDDNYSVTEQS